MKYTDNYVAIIKKTDNPDDFLIKKCLPGLQVFGFQEGTSYLYRNDINQLHVNLGEELKEQINDNDVVSFFLTYDYISNPFKNCKVENLNIINYQKCGRDTIEDLDKRNKIFTKMIEKNIYFCSKFHVYLIGTDYEYILFDNSKISLDVFRACLKISEEKECFTINSVLNRMQCSYKEIKSVLDSLIYLGYLVPQKFKYTNILSSVPLYKFNRNLLKKHYVIYPGSFNIRTVEEEFSSTVDIHDVLSEQFIIDNLDKYSKPPLEIENEYRTYLCGHCPKCESKEVTGSNLIKYGKHYYYNGKCHKCGCDYKEYYNAYYVGTSIIEGYLIYELEYSLEDKELCKSEDKCPHCQSENIDINETDYINDYLYFAKECKCKDCGGEFRQWYVLHNVRTYSIENNEEVLAEEYFCEEW